VRLAFSQSPGLCSTVVDGTSARPQSLEPHNTADIPTQPGDFRNSKSNLFCITGVARAYITVQVRLPRVPE
jgi:hypothetical protein